MEKIKEYLKENKNKKNISYEELINLFPQLGYEALAEKISLLVDEGKLKIRNKKNTNGRNPLMYLKYSIVEDEDNFEKEIKEIKALNATLNISYYINKPKEYRKHREIIQDLNKYITYSNDKMSMRISINERSYDIWGREKLLRDPSTDTILKNLGLSKDRLKVYSTPEPFFYYVNDENIKCVLIIENKDTWFSIRKYLKEVKNEILGLKVGLLIYGEGKKIESSIEFLQEPELDCFMGSKVFYWGDLDFEGIDIYYRLCKKLNVELFLEAYEKMIDLANVNKLQLMKDKQNTSNELKCFLDNFHVERKNKLIELFSKRKYIPQEIINYYELERDKHNEFK